ncbi:MAG: tetratricopeptide repeat protein [Verrucomicrobia bacterium]|nr:tetratricopeptide repeat protein [Verrucomicrobiota bacterium]
MELPQAARPNPHHLAAPESPEPSTLLLGKIATGLALLTLLIFSPVVGLNWINYDDDVFVTNNPKVAGGLTWEGIKWAFTSADIDYWRPLSWLSHMLDIELFGPVAAGHHLVNLLIHCAAVVMAFLALSRITRAVWPSAMVAALFAWHPLHVESVVWIAERKDVLCGFFFFLTIWAYARYVESPSPRRYLTVFGAFILGVMSKPMIITMPCVLLLLDFWPLNRISLPPIASGWAAGWRECARQFWKMFAEKLPLFGVVLVMCFSTIYSQHQVGTMSDLSDTPLDYRVRNSLAAYGTYLWQTIWPTRLAVLYPLQQHQALGPWVASALILGVLSVTCLACARRLPFLLTGWLWYLGVLVPVVGFVQVGEQAHADRYTYLPLVGIFCSLVWGARYWAGDRAERLQSLRVAAGVVLVSCAVLTRSQLAHWDNSITLFTHAAKVTANNATAYNNVGAELRILNKPKESILWLEESIRIAPRPNSLWNLGMSWHELGDNPRAQLLVYRAFRESSGNPSTPGLLATMRTAAQSQPENYEIRKLIAIALSVRKDYEGAQQILAEAINVAPQDIPARLDRAAYLAILGRETEALSLLEETLRMAPTNAPALSNYAALLAKRGRGQDALAHYQTALKAAPDNADTRYNYALLLLRSRRTAEAKAEFETVLRREIRHWRALQQLAWIVATQEKLRDGPAALQFATDAVQLAPERTPELLDVLAAAQAAAGHHRRAAATLTEAIELARKKNQRSLEAPFLERLKLYQADRPFTAPE